MCYMLHAIQVIVYVKIVNQNLQGRIISVCDDGEVNTIHLWEVNKKEGKSVLEEVKTCTLEGRLDFFVLF